MVTIKQINAINNRNLNPYTFRTEFLVIPGPAGAPCGMNGYKHHHHESCYYIASQTDKWCIRKLIVIIE
jgi:hypothetical protein